VKRHHSTFVFLGPTLPVDEARTLLDAVYLPPAAVGDVYRLVRDAAPVRIAIIDGYFERMAAVWHKEVLFALSQRVAVFGASSMGALRAAELAPFGMVGVGAIFNAFRRGTLTDDDEVAVAHLPASSGYAAVSTAMVDLRAGLARLRIPATHRARLLALAKARFYRDRTWDALVSDAAAAHLPARVVRTLAAGAPVPQKARDARLLLRRLAREREVRPARPRWVFSKTWFWDRFIELADAG
jgi:hypothetical protein